MTSLNLPGVSFTVLLLPRAQTELGQTAAPLDSDRIISLLDEPTRAPGWRWHAKSDPRMALDSFPEVASSVQRAEEQKLSRACFFARHPKHGTCRSLTTPLNATCSYSRRRALISAGNPTSCGGISQVRAGNHKDGSDRWGWRRWPNFEIWRRGRVRFEVIRLPHR